MDLNDVINNHDDEHSRKVFLSRALAAFPVIAFTSAPPVEVGLSVTDGTGDNGIDVIHYDMAQERLYVVQSKWNESGRGSPTAGDVHKFLQGIRDLVNLKFDRFNAKVRARTDEITAALDNPRVSIEAIFVHTGSEDQKDEISDLYSDLMDQINDGGDILSLRTMRQADVHALVSGEVEGDGIDLDVALFDWGQVTDPYTAFYGQVAASDIAAWHSDHGAALFARNIRKFIKDSDVNQTISQSVTSSPATFWYFNNGITILCQSIQRKAIGGTDRKHGQFSCSGISVVNGAQTVGSIGEALARSGLPDDETTDARVLVRLISLENCPAEFSVDVTRATNTQNRIVSRDFVALDAEQERLRVELRIEGKTYALKTGDPEPLPDDGCSVVDATVALGCADPDVQMAVQVKREIGRIWENTASQIYTRLFNAGTTSTKVWRSVEVLREVDTALRKIQSVEESRRRQVAVHGNRLLLHLVYRGLETSAFIEGSAGPDLSKIEDRVTELFEATVLVIESDYEGNYLASLFKNATKCKSVVESVLAATSPAA